jgi:hypothetical protein
MRAPYPRLSASSPRYRWRRAYPGDDLSCPAAVISAFRMHQGFSAIRAKLVSSEASSKVSKRSIKSAPHACVSESFVRSEKVRRREVFLSVCKPETLRIHEPIMDLGIAKGHLNPAGLGDAQAFSDLGSVGQSSVGFDTLAQYATADASGDSAYGGAEYASFDRTRRTRSARNSPASMAGWVRSSARPGCQPSRQRSTPLHRRPSSLPRPSTIQLAAIWRRWAVRRSCRTRLTHPCRMFGLLWMVRCSALGA